MKIKIDKAKIEEINSLLLILLLFIGILTQPIVNRYGNSIVLWTSIFLMIVLSIVINRKINIRLFLIILLFIIIFIINYLFVDYKNLVIKEFANFFRAGIVSLFLTSMITDYKRLLKWWYRLGVLSFFICNCMLNFFIDNNLYMDFGIYISYSFIIFCLYYYNDYSKNKKINLILMVTCFVEVCVFANRGSILICLFTTIYYEIISMKKNKSFRNISKMLCIILIGILITFNTKKILDTFTGMLDSMNINSYAINKIELSLNNGWIEESSGRDELLDMSIDIIKNSSYMPNGIGYFEYITDGTQPYPHNILLEICITFGIVGLILFLVFLVRIVYKFKTIQSDEYFKNTIIIIFIYSSIRLMLSSSLWKESLFWIGIGLILFINRKSDSLQIK